MEDRIRTIIAIALGETSALFMSQERRGVDMEMPSEKLGKIVEETTELIKEFIIEG